VAVQESAWERRRALVPAVIAAIAAFAAFQFVPPLRSYEAAAQDFRFRLPHRRRLDPRVVIVALDQQTLDAEGKTNRAHPRLRHAQLLHALHAAGAAVIGFDVLFDQPADAPADDTAFAQAIRADGPVVLGLYQRANRGETVSESERTVVANTEAQDWLAAHDLKFPVQTTDVPINAYTIGLPATALRAAAAAVGGVDVPAESGVYRSARLFTQDNQGHWWPSLSAAMFGQFAATVRATPSDILLWQQLRSDPDRIVRIDFAGVPGTIPHLSYSDIQDALQTHPEQVRGKIVLVGETHGTADDKPNPTSPIAKGVEIHANLLNGMLAHRFLHSVPRYAELALDLGFALVAGLCLLRLRTGWGATALAGLLGGYLALSQALFSGPGLLLPLLGPLTAAALAAWSGVQSRLAEEETARRRVEAHWRSYVGPDVMQEIMNNPELAQGRGIQVHATIVFSDIRGYSGLAEKLAPDVVFRQINEHFDEMAQIVFAYGGTVLGVTGDGLLMVFGWPHAYANHVDRAVLAAQEIAAGLTPLNLRWAAEGRPPIDIGLGLHCGSVIAGRVGSEEGSQMTVIGDAVNVAARVQDLNKPLHTRILITDEVRQHLTVAVAFGKSEQVALRGRAEGILVHELLPAL
jgi:adenylate cyclase